MIISTFCVALCCLSSVIGQRVVDTEYGQVRGHVVWVDNGRENTTVDVFYGIPFANDTSGALRFLSPVPPPPWTGILEADTMPPACPQAGGINAEEDCLKLNVYAPTDTSQTYPVMVWIYGGAYQSGANSMFPGHFLASRGVIIVTLNYRLGKFGFSYLGNDACPGNAGLWDQQMGIQWTADNIANFGGNPTQITVFGESAGASSTSLQMLSPKSNKLFQQAIIESGSELVFWGLNPPESHPENYTIRMAEDLSCYREDDYAMMDCMRELSWRQISINSSIGRCAEGYICLGMAPVVDGPDGFMPQKPAQQRLDGEVMQGSIMAGINKEDGSLFAPVVAPLIFFDDCCNRSYFELVLRDNMIGHFASRMSNKTMDALFEGMNWNYSPWPHIYDTDANRDQIVKLVTDVSFGAPWDRQVKDQHYLAPTWSYMYDYMSNLSNSADWLGTPHAAEIDYVWGFPLLRSNPDVQDDSGLNGGLYTQQDYDFSIFVMELWTNFAKTGNPTPTPVENPIDGGPFTWPAFTQDSMNYMNMGSDSIRVEQQYIQQDMAFWQDYLIWMAGDELGLSDEWPGMSGIDGEMIADLYMEHLMHLFLGGGASDVFFLEEK